jgi:hypothetical protein
LSASTTQTAPGSSTAGPSGSSDETAPPEATPIIATAPLSPQDELLRNKLTEDVTAQAGRMDELAKQLITLELALPGLYATALKLVAGIKATLAASTWLYLAFGCWALALLLAIASLIPRDYRVDPDRLRGGPSADGLLSIEGYFRRAARIKRWHLLPSCALFFVGIWFAVLTVL